MRSVRQKYCVILAALFFTGASFAQTPTTPRGRGPGRGAQTPAPPQGRQDGLDPSPINPATDPNIDMFLGDWRKSTPRTMYGHLVFHDILTQLQGPDKLHPTKRGAVLEDIQAVSYAMLPLGAAASGRVPDGQRQ